MALAKCVLVVERISVCHSGSTNKNDRSKNFIKHKLGLKCSGESQNFLGQSSMHQVHNTIVHLD